MHQNALGGRAPDPLGELTALPQGIGVGALSTLGGHKIFARKIYIKISNMPEFYTILARKIIKMPEFL